VELRIVFSDGGGEEKFRKLEEKTRILGPAFRDAGVYMKEEIMINFSEEGRPRKWKPLSAKYLEYKMQKKGSSKILEFTGRLKNSINTQYSNDKAKVFTGVKYGVKHQMGLGVPARPFFPDSQNSDIPPFDSKGKENISSIFIKHLKSGGVGV